MVLAAVSVMRYWASTVFGWRYWLAFFALCGLMAYFGIRLLVVLLYALDKLILAACEALGHLLRG